MNGRLQAEEPGGDYRSSNHPLFIGAEAAGRGRAADYFVGAIDEVRLSNVVRYEGKFKPARFHGRDANTLLLLHFDTDTSAAFFDDSRLEHAGRPVGTPTIELEKR